MNTHTLPDIPPNHDFARDTFWQKYRAGFIRKQPGPKEWSWYERERKYYELRDKPFPPKPVFYKVQAALPQPWDGGNERAGRVPREGK